MGHCRDAGDDEEDVFELDKELEFAERRELGQRSFGSLGGDYPPLPPPPIRQ